MAAPTDACGISKIDKTLGKGTYGMVYRVIYRGRPFALKTINYSSVTFPELDILLSFNHPYLSRGDKIVRESDCPTIIKKHDVGILLPLAEGTLSGVDTQIQPETFTWWQQLA